MTEDKAAKITHALDELFPTGGKKESIQPIREQCDALACQISEYWFTLPSALQIRILDIEAAVCGREPFALHVHPFMSDGDIDPLDD